jgi:hypothetical protein
MEMSESTYWDASEFDFFQTLEDEDKLLYLYDLMVGEFSYMEIHKEGESLDKEMEELDESFKQAETELNEYSDDEDEEQDIWDFETDRNLVKVTFEDGVDSDIIKITGPTLGVLLKVASDLQMNGMLLTDINVTFTKYKPWNVILTYKLIGQVPPTSLN